jgi:hypothetical protein
VSHPGSGKNLMRCTSGTVFADMGWGRGPSICGQMTRPGTNSVPTSQVSIVLHRGSVRGTLPTVHTARAV